MQFIKTENLKKGMRLARPIYNQSGVLLFERNSLLTVQAIDSVRNFGLLGIYILEPAEPLPPMSEEDLEFERFQVMCGFSIQDELENIITKGRQNRIQTIISMILRKYGYLDEKVNFYQNLRSREDYVSRHTLNTAILCAMMTHVLNIQVEDQNLIMHAAILHDIGKINCGEKSIYDGGLEDEEETRRLYQILLKGGEMIENAFGTDGAAIRRICTLALKMQYENHRPENLNPKIFLCAQILLVANRYDELTAMNLKGNARSEIKAVKELLENTQMYDSRVVRALIRSVNIVKPGVSVELNTGEKALIVSENEQNILRPLVLSFRNNDILDLSLPINEDIELVDIMKTLDNRYIMDNKTLSEIGYNTEAGKEGK